MPGLEEYELTIAPQYDPRYTPSPVPGVGVFDPPLQMVCINAKWWSHVEGLIDRLAWSDAWIAPDEVSMRATLDGVIEIMREIGIGRECEEMPVRLRQSPSDKCVLEYSTDGGRIWNAAFDFSACSLFRRRSFEVDMTFIHNAQTVLNDNRIIYQGDIINVSPGWDFSRGDPRLRERALCYALRLCVDLVVATIAEIRRNEYEDEDDFFRDISNLFGSVSGLVFGGIAVGLAPVWAPWTAIGFAIATVAINLVRVIEDVDLSLLENQDLRSELVCCAYESMQGETPTYAGFSNSLVDCGLSGSAEELRALVAPFFQDEDIFMQLFIQVEPVISAQQRGAQVPCDCIEWCVDLDLSAATACIDRHLWSYSNGELVAVGRGCKDLPNDSRIIGACLEFAGGMAYEATRVELDIVRQGDVNCGSSGLTVSLLDDELQTVARENLAVGGETGLVKWEFSQTSFNHMRLATRLPVGRAFVIDGARIYGIGVLPPGASFSEVHGGRNG